MFFLNEAYVALVEAEQWAYGAIKRLETIQKDKIGISIRNKEKPSNGLALPFSHYATQPPLDRLKYHLIDKILYDQWSTID